MMLSLDGVNAKIRRAEEHLQIIKDEIRAWHNTDPYRFVKQTNADFTRHGFIVHFERPLPSERFSLLAGDCVHALRSALDHLIYAIAVSQSNSDPPPHSRSLQFPIADTHDLFKAAAKRYLKGLSVDVATEIELLQPYHRPNPKVPPLLGILRDFDDTDKHRLLNVIVSSQAQADLLEGIEIPPKQTVTVYFHEAPIKDGTEIFAVAVQTPQPDMDLKMRFRLTVGIQHAKGPAGADFSDVFVLLSVIRDEVVTTIKRVSSKS